MLTISDITATGMCPGGLAKWFKDNDVDYKAFKRGEYRLCDFEDFDDAYVKLVLDGVRARIAKEGGDA